MQQKNIFPFTHVSPFRNLFSYMRSFGIIPATHSENLPRHIWQVNPLQQFLPVSQCVVGRFLPPLIAGVRVIKSFGALSSKPVILSIVVTLPLTVNHNHRSCPCRTVRRDRKSGPRTGFSVYYGLHSKRDSLCRSYSSTRVGGQGIEYSATD